MEITRDALLRVVKSARLAMKTAETIQDLMMEKGRWTMADEIAGLLSDALFRMSGEELAAGKDFNKDSMTMRLLKGDMSDGAVADWFMMMSRIRDRISGELVADKMVVGESVTQPKPHTTTTGETYELYLRNGGYHYTPEGEFHDK